MRERCESTLRGFQRCHHHEPRALIIESTAGATTLDVRVGVVLVKPSLQKWMPEGDARWVRYLQTVFVIYTRERAPASTPNPSP